MVERIGSGRRGDLLYPRYRAGNRHDRIFLDQEWDGDPEYAGAPAVSRLDVDLARCVAANEFEYLHLRLAGLNEYRTYRPPQRSR